MHIRCYQNWGRNDLGGNDLVETSWREMVLGAKRLGYMVGGGETTKGEKRGETTWGRNDLLPYGLLVQDLN